MNGDALRDALRTMPRPWKRAILLCFDTFVLLSIIWIAYSARFGEPFVPNPQQALLIAAAPIIALPVFVRLGLYRAVIRYLPERAIWTIVQATTFASLLWVGLVFLTQMSGIEGVPRSVPLLYWALSTTAISGSRYAMRWILNAGQTVRGDADPVLIYGAGAAGRQLAEALKSHGNSTIVGFLDDDASLHGSDVAGVRIFSPDDLESLVETLGVRQVIISIRALSSLQRAAIAERLSGYAVRTLVLPSIADIAAGKYTVSQLRSIDIDDLLGRSPVPPDPDLLREMTEGRHILVTGAGGSIGSELCRLLARWRPGRLVLFEANENALYRIDQEIREKVDIPVVAILGSVEDADLVARALADNHVDTVYHAAAHKHVPLIESNVIEGVRNNVLGARVLADAAFAAGVSRFVLISSDKSVRPSNVMGATKRWAEIIVADVAQRAARAGTDQRFCAVRFGNVLGSSGSVVPLFQRQIETGGPVTLTHEDMTRYFMSIHEAVELIVQAGALSQGGDIFLLEMGEPIRIADVATNMIRLAGLTVRSPENPGGDMEIAVIGPRPGEKMSEELFYDADHAMKTRHPKIFRELKNGAGDVDIAAGLERLTRDLASGDPSKVRDTLFSFLKS